MEFGKINMSDAANIRRIVKHYYEFHRTLFQAIIGSLGYDGYGAEDVAGLVEDFEAELQKKLST